MNAIPKFHPRFDRAFYLSVSVLFFAIILWVFARTYYLKLFFQTPPLPLLLHIHGAVMSGWVALLAIQTGLITSHHVGWHRKVGVFGAIWAGLVVILGSTTTVHAAIREVDLHSDRAMMQVAVCTLELMQMALFAGLVIAAIHYRRRLDYHKRLMLLTIGCLLPSATSRLPMVQVTNLIILMSFNGFVLACVVIDALRHRRIHPAFAWGGASLLVGLNLTYAIAMTKGWQTFGVSILG